MKPAVFLEELKTRVNYLKSKGENTSFDTPFEDKKEFFSILNSFETSSRKESCVSRKLPTPQVYNIKDHKIPTLLPAMILAFEDQSVMSMVSTFVLYYIDHAIAQESERNRCKTLFKQILTHFFGVKQFEYKSLSFTFEEDKFFTELNSESNNDKFTNWVNL